MAKISLEWGEDWHGKEHSEQYTCINDKCKMYYKGYFDKEPPARSIAIGVRKAKGKLETHYILTCECPKCYSKYWFHITEKEASKLQPKNF